MPNALAAATSPYLLQHQHNPVDWQEWNEATLARARAENRPILLSIGYAACHWCHVMAHESFENEATAAVMNRLFVNIKVDREERPDLDTVYQQALAVMGQQGGWPMTMFLSPTGEPFWGGTYFPPEPRYGRPGFVQILEQVAELWRSGDQRIATNRQAISQALSRLAAPEPGEPLPAGAAGETAQRLAQRFDAVHGGLAGAPKFPQAPILRLIWEEARRSGDLTLRHRVLHTLARIAQGGIYDHLGGGFARYSVDAYWLVPHFEKMLYDNAQLLELLASAHAATGEALFAACANETVAWLEREMLVDGAFASALDADSEGEEGRFYVWDAGEIDRLLGADATAFRLAYGVTDIGNWEGRNVLNRLHEPGLPAASEAALLARCRAVLLSARARRVRPGRDDKVLADWNGLMIAALARASGQLDRPEWLGLAEAAFVAALRHMSEGDRLFHSWRAGRRLPVDFLDDYAQMARAALALFQRTGTTGYLRQARAWVERCRTDFHDDRSGGYFLSTAATDGPIVRPKNAHDGPTPSANGTLAEVAATLWHLTGEEEYRAMADEILAAFARDAGENPAGHATLLLATCLLTDAVQVVVVGDEATPGFTAIWGAASSTLPPGGILLRLAPGAELPPAHPAAGKRLLAGRAAAYLCHGTACEAPRVEPQDLRERLLRPDLAA
jgi:uncharacterized protein YyaL (SSP411 family)